MSGNVKYELAPVHAFLLLRGVIWENQLLVPYVGGGVTRVYYRQSIERQEGARGSVDGYHGRAGLQLLLDDIDPSAANNMFLDYGVEHTYLFVELQKVNAMINTPEINIVGKYYLMGFSFEY